MVESGTRVAICVTMEPSAAEFGNSITDKWNPTIEYDGNFYPSIMIECKDPILPGKSGELTLYLLHSKDISIQRGDDIKLLEGSRLIGIGNIK